MAVSWQGDGQERAHRVFQSLGEDASRDNGPGPRENRPRLLHLVVPPPQQTLLEAAQGDGALANEVILRGRVIILHHEAHEGKLRHDHLKHELCVPPWVETWQYKPHVNSVDQLQGPGPTQAHQVPLLVTTAVWRLATSRPTPWISTVTLGSTIEFLFLLTFGSCCPEMT